MFSDPQGGSLGEGACRPDHFVPGAKEEGLTSLQARQGGKTQIWDMGGHLEGEGLPPQSRSQAPCCWPLVSWCPVEKHVLTTLCPVVPHLVMGTV